MFIWFFIFLILFIIVYNVFFYLLNSFLLSKLNKSPKLKIHFDSVGLFSILKGFALELFLVQKEEHEIEKEVPLDGASLSEVHSKFINNTTHTIHEKNSTNTENTANIPDDIDSKDLNFVNESSKTNVLSVDSSLGGNLSENYKKRLSVAVGGACFIPFFGGSYITIQIKDVVIDIWKDRKFEIDHSEFNSSLDTSNKNNKDLKKLFSNISLPWYIEKLILPYIKIEIINIKFTIHNEQKSDLTLSSEKICIKGDNHPKESTISNSKNIFLGISFNQLEAFLQREYHSKRELLPVLKSKSVELSTISRIENNLLNHTSISIFSNVVDAWSNSSIISAIKLFSQKEEKLNRKVNSKPLKDSFSSFPFGILIKFRIDSFNLQIEAVDKHSPLYLRTKNLEITANNNNDLESINIASSIDRLQMEVENPILDSSLVDFKNWRLDSTILLSKNRFDIDLHSRVGKFFSNISPFRISWIKTIIKLLKDKKIVKQINSTKKNEKRNQTQPSISLKMKFSIDELASHLQDTEGRTIFTLTTNSVNTLVNVDKNSNNTNSEVKLLLGKLLLSFPNLPKIPSQLVEVDNKTLSKFGDHPLAISSCTLTVSTSPSNSKVQIDFGHILTAIATESFKYIESIIANYKSIFSTSSEENQLIIIKKEEKKEKRSIQVNVVSSSFRILLIDSSSVLSLKLSLVKCLISNQLITILSETSKGYLNTILKNGLTKKFECIFLQKFAYLMEKDKGHQFSLSQLKINWNVPIHLQIGNIVKEIKTLAKKFSKPEKIEKKDKSSDSLPIALKCQNINLNAEFTPSASLSVSIYSISSRDIFSSPISLSEISVYINHIKFGDAESTTIQLNQHPQIHSFSNSFIELHQQVINPSNLNFRKFKDILYITISVQTPNISIPHEYPLGNLINEIKSAKKVFLPTKPRFPGMNKNRAFPLIPRIYLKVSNLSFEMKDNIIEETLIIHRILWKQHAKEYQERIEHLENQIQDGVIPSDKIEDVRSRLMEVNALDYLNHMNDYLKKFKKRGIINCTIQEIACDIFRNSRLKTYDDAILFMQQISNPSLPKDDKGEIKDFGIIAAISMNITVKKIDVTIRNHPYSMFQGDQISVYTTFIPMYIYGTPGVNTLTKYIDVGLGEKTPINSSLTGGFRLFLDATCALNGSSVIYGPMYDPILNDIQKFIKLFVPKSGSNPSPPLKWWDKLRLMLHSQLRITLNNTNIKFVVGVDPYDQTDSLETQIKNISIEFKDYKINANIKGVYITYNPSLVDFPIGQIPDITISSSISFENKYQDSNNSFFPIIIPNNLKTIYDIQKFKGKIDLYEKWRMNGYNLSLDILFSTGSIGNASVATPTLMCNPIACSWIIEFIKFMTKKPFQVKSLKKSLRNEDLLSLSQMKRNLDIRFKVNGINIIWTNGYNQNDILHVTASDIQFSRKESKLPCVDKDEFSPKLKTIVTENSIEASNLSFKVYSYDSSKRESLYKFSKRQSFLSNHMLSMGKIVYKSNDRSDALPPGLEELQSYSTFLLVYDMHLIWTSALRDALFQWIDMVQQFIFTSKNVVGNRSAKIGSKIPDNPFQTQDLNSPKSPTTPLLEKGIELIEEILNQSKSNNIKPPKENIDKFLGVGLIRPKYGLLGDENHESLMFNSPTGLLLFQNIMQDISQNRRMELFVVLHSTTVFWIDSRKYQLSQCWSVLEVDKKQKHFPVAIDTCNFVIHYIESKTGQIPRKKLILGFPSLDLYFTSTQIRAFIDVISNVLVPKKKGPKLVLEDQKQTFTLMSKLAPDQWENIRQLKQLCRQIRIEIRNDIFSMNQMQRSYKNGEKELLSKIQTLESKIQAKKASFHIMKEALQKAATKALAQEKETTCQPDFKIDMEFFNVTLNMKDSQEKTFVIVSLMNFHGVIIKNTDYSAYHTFSVHEIRAENLLPNPVYSHIIGPVTNVEHQVLTDNDECISITVNKSSPIGGMHGFDHLQITIAPLAIRFTYDLYKKFWSYMFPNVKFDAEDDLPKKQKGSKKVANDDLHEAITDAFLQGYVDTMKSRAAQRKIFKYIRFDETELYLSFRGTTDDKTPKLMKFVSSFDETRVHIRPLMYNSETWSWTELAERLKRDIALEALQHILPESMKSLGINKVKNIQEWLRSSLKISNSSRSNEFETQGRASGKIVNAYKLNHSLQEKQMHVLKKTGESRHQNQLKAALLLGDKAVGHGGKHLLGNEYKSQDEVIEIVEKENQALDESLFDELIQNFETHEYENES